MTSPLSNSSMNNSKLEGGEVGEAHVFFAVTLDFVQVVEYVLSTFSIALCSTGVVTNVINIVVFIKMGFSETINIMFVVLSICDLILSVVMIISNCTILMAYGNTNVLFLDIFDMALVLNPFTWAFFGLGSCVTALIAVDRSVCIALPLKVRTIFTRRRVVMLIIFFIAITTACLVQLYAVMELQWLTEPVTNRTGLVFVVTKYSQDLSTIAKLAFSIGPSTISFIVVSVGTAFLIFKLKENTRWRKSSSTGTQKQEISSKETRVIRSAVLVCLVYIVCFTPNVCIITALFIDPRLHFAHPYYGPFIYVLLLFTNTCQNISSACNIYIYLATSIRYKETFMLIFCCTGHSKIKSSSTVEALKKK